MIPARSFDGEGNHLVRDADSTPGPARILAAEDSLVVRAILRDNLLARGFEVIEAEDGQEALDRARESLPDVILLDVEMPRKDGYQTLAELTADPELRDVPVVFLTGRVTADDVAEGLRRGAYDYLRKPFETNELIARVNAALRTKRLQDELRSRNAELDLATRTDPLTGLFNRRHLDEQLQLLWSLAVRHERDLAAIMLDVDHFKHINDTFGHAAGDAALVGVARELHSQLRKEDVAARWGGEEFLVLLPETDLADAHALAERIRVRLECGEIESVAGLGSVTASFGCAAGTWDSGEGLIKRADIALYEAKDGGRNRVVDWHE